MVPLASVHTTRAPKLPSSTSAAVAFSRTTEGPLPSSTTTSAPSAGALMVTTGAELVARAPSTRRLSRVTGPLGPNTPVSRRTRKSTSLRPSAAPRSTTCVAAGRVPVKVASDRHDTPSRLYSQCSTSSPGSSAPPTTSRRAIAPRMAVRSSGAASVAEARRLSERVPVPLTRRPPVTSQGSDSVQRASSLKPSFKSVSPGIDSATSSTSSMIQPSAVPASSLMRTKVTSSESPGSTPRRTTRSAKPSVDTDSTATSRASPAIAPANGCTCTKPTSWLSTSRRWAQRKTSGRLAMPAMRRERSVAVAPLA